MAYGPYRTGVCVSVSHMRSQVNYLCAHSPCFSEEAVMVCHQILKGVGDSLRSLERHQFAHLTTHLMFRPPHPVLFLVIASSLSFYNTCPDEGGRNNFTSGWEVRFQLVLKASS